MSGELLDEALLLRLIRILDRDLNGTRRVVLQANLGDMTTHGVKKIVDLGGAISNRQLRQRHLPHLHTHAHTHTTQQQRRTHSTSTGTVSNSIKREAAQFGQIRVWLAWGAARHATPRTAALCSAVVCVLCV